MELKKNPSKDIHRRYPLHFVAGLCLSCGLVIGLFEMQFRKQDFNRPDPSDWDGPMTLISPGIIVDSPEPVIKQRTPVQVVRKELTSTVLSTPDAEQETEPLNQADPFAQPETSAAVAVVVVLSDEPLLMAEEMPEPIDGFQKFYKQLGRDLRYPRKAAALEIEGKVFVEFVIDREGRPTMLKVISGIGHGCDEEAMRVLMKAKWKPGKQHGAPVRVRMVMPIKFSLTR